MTETTTAAALDELPSGSAAGTPGGRSGPTKGEGSVEELRAQYRRTPGAALAVALAEQEVPTLGSLPPAWLGAEGERSLASSRVLLNSEDLRARFDQMWREYERSCAKMAVLARRVRVLERACELLDASNSREHLRRTQRDLASARSQHAEFESGPWDCIRGIREVVEQHRRREVYHMAAARWSSLRRDAEDALGRSDTSVPEVVAGAVLVAVYALARMVLTSVGVPAGGVASTASILSLALAAVASARVYATQFKVRSLAMSRAAGSLATARRFETACRNAAAGGDEPPPEAMNPNERELLARAARLAEAPDGTGLVEQVALPSVALTSTPA